MENHPVFGPLAKKTDLDGETYWDGFCRIPEFADYYNQKHHQTPVQSAVSHLERLESTHRTIQLRPDSKRNSVLHNYLGDAITKLYEIGYRRVDRYAMFDGKQNHGFAEGMIHSTDRVFALVSIVWHEEVRLFQPRIRLHRILADGTQLQFDDGWDSFSLGVNIENASEKPGQPRRANEVARGGIVRLASRFEGTLEIPQLHAEIMDRSDGPDAAPVRGDQLVRVFEKGYAQDRKDALALMQEQLERVKAEALNGTPPKDEETLKETSRSTDYIRNEPHESLERLRERGIFVLMITPRPPEGWVDDPKIPAAWNRFISRQTAICEAIKAKAIENWRDEQDSPLTPQSLAKNMELSGVDIESYPDAPDAKVELNFECTFNDLNYFIVRVDGDEIEIFS